MNNKYKNMAKVKAIERKNTERLLKVNPDLDDKSGIYFLTRENEDNIKFAYVGQARDLISRMCQHMVGYQHIDLSIKRHGLYSADNPCGWKIGFMHFPISELDEKERYYITLYAKNGYQMRNKDTGGGEGKSELGERKPAKGYRDGLLQGRKSASKEISHLFEKHLNYSTKSEKPNKNQQKAIEKFEEFLGFYKKESEE